jgi:hypothetical protein
MIELTLTELALAAVGLAMLSVVLFGGLGRWRQAAGERRAARCRIICRDCGHAWQDESRERIVECPECGVRNRKGRDQRLG